MSKIRTLSGFIVSDSPIVEVKETRSLGNYPKEMEIINYGESYYDSQPVRELLSVEDRYTVEWLENAVSITKQLTNGCFNRFIKNNLTTGVGTIQANFLIDLHEIINRCAYKDLLKYSNLLRLSAGSIRTKVANEKEVCFEEQIKNILITRPEYSTFTVNIKDVDLLALILEIIVPDSQLFVSKF